MFTIVFSAFYLYNIKDSPRGEADGQSFVYGSTVDEFIDKDTSNERRDSSFSDQLHGRDSGIDSASQASPSPNTVAYLPNGGGSPTPSLSNATKNRRPSSALLHPDHARLLPLQNRCQPTSSPDQSSTEDLTEHLSCANAKQRPNDTNQRQHHFYLASPSTTSSMTSIAGSNKNNRYLIIELRIKHQFVVLI